MDVAQLEFDQKQAALLLRKYKEHKAYQKPIDREIEKIAGLIAQGKAIILGVGSVVKAGLNKANLPMLAIGRADVADVTLDTNMRGGCRMLSGVGWIDGRTAPSRIYSIPDGSLPNLLNSGHYKAVMPHMPPDIRPHRGLENYTILWEADWKYEPPVDPILARRIGHSDFFTVLAQWDLTPVERFVMQSRLPERNRH